MNAMVWRSTRLSREVAENALKERNYSASVVPGENRQIPHPDERFDLLLSVNTLHYETDEVKILDALKEFRRVLKPGGIAYISTVGPQHDIYRLSETLGQHRHLIQNYDFRNGEEFFFDNQKYLAFYCGQVFSSVETG